MRELEKATMELNMRLATLLGWTNIFSTGTTLMGKPPYGVTHCRDQAILPNWAGDWTDCGPLIVRYRVYPDENDVATFWWKLPERCELKNDLDATMRHYITSVVVERLERVQSTFLRTPYA